MPKNTTPATDQEIADAKPMWSDLDIASFMDLASAYRNSSSNDESAEILRLFCTNIHAFKDKFGTPNLDKWTKKYRETNT